MKYSISLDLGLFLEDNYQRKIINEELSVNGNVLFKRGEKLNLNNLNVIKKYLPETTEQNSESALGIAQNSLNQEELFLTNGFKLIFSHAFVKVRSV